MRMVLNGEVVDTSPGGGIYSAEQTRIGTLFGKPFYRKVIELDSPKEVKKDEVIYLLPDNVELKIVNASATYFNGAGQLALPYFYSTTMYYTFWIYSHQIFARCSDQTHLGGKITFVLEYTKTTD